MFCLECGCDMVESIDLITEEYRGERLTVYDIEHCVCPQCGEYAVGAKAAKELARELVNAYEEMQAPSPQVR